METAIFFQHTFELKSRKGNVSLYTIFVILVVVFAVGGYFLGSNQAKKQLQQASQKPVLPVVLSAKDIKYAAAKYTFSGKVLGIKKVARGLELTTDIKNPGTPKFIVTPKTKVVTVDSKGVATVASSSAIAANQNVEIIAAYQLRKKSWSPVSFVRVLSSSTNSSVPTKTGI